MGTGRDGGILLGLLDNNGHWAVTTAIPRGPFAKTVEVPADGEYRVVIANNLRGWQTKNDVEIRGVGFVGLDPASFHVPRP